MATLQIYRKEFQSTPLIRGETVLVDAGKRSRSRISIHSPHTRGDIIGIFQTNQKCLFQSTPLIRGETPSLTQKGSASKFQSTPLIRGETKCNSRRAWKLAFQSTPLIRGETICCKRLWKPAYISIHSPHTRGDGWLFPAVCGILDFNPLPSYEGRHEGQCDFHLGLHISIHSPHTRGDSISLQKSIQIYVSLHNKTMIHRFSELYKPLFAAQSPIFGVRSPRESHDSFTFARLSEGSGITP